MEYKIHLVKLNTVKGDSPTVVLLMLECVHSQMTMHIGVPKRVAGTCIVMKIVRDTARVSLCPKELLISGTFLDRNLWLFCIEDGPLVLLVRFDFVSYMPC